MKIRTVIFFYALIFFTSCNVSQNIDGKYRSNFSQLGFFVTEIELNPNKTFNYKHSGDLQHTELVGNYKVENKNLYLRFDKLKGETDSNAIRIVGNDTIVDFEKIMNSHSYELKKENGIEYHLKYKISKNKLLIYHTQTNKIVRKARTYSDTKKYYKKKYFLQKMEK